MLQFQSESKNKQAKNTEFICVFVVSPSSQIAYFHNILHENTIGLFQEFVPLKSGGSFIFPNYIDNMITYVFVP